LQIPFSPYVPRSARLSVFADAAQKFPRSSRNSVSSAHEARTEALQTIPNDAHHGALSRSPEELPAMPLGDSASESGVRASALPLAQPELNRSQF